MPRVRRVGMLNASGAAPVSFVAGRQNVRALMKLLNLATLGVRLTGIAVIALALIVGGSAVVTQVARARGTENRRETIANDRSTTITETIVKGSFDPLPLAPSMAGLALGLVLILAGGPVARILILGVDE